MSNQTLEQRVSALERKVTELEALTNGGRERNWERTFGMFAGDEVAKRVDEAILKAREAERRKARQQGAKPKMNAKRRVKA
jgi:hypothetical protein